MPISGPTIPQDLFGRSFVEKSLEIIKESGNAICLIDEAVDKEYSFDTLYRRSVSIAVKLKKLGIGKNTVVSTLIDNSIESVSFQFGTWFSGAISNPVNQFLKTDEIRTCISVSEPKIIFCSNKYLGLVENAIKNIGWDVKIVTTEKKSQYMFYGEFLNEDLSKFQVKIDDPVNHIVSVLFTSGTTGVPKAVKLRDESFFIMSTAYKSGVEIKKTMLTSPMFWISNTSSIARNIINRVITIFPSKSDAESLLKSITKYKPNTWFTGASVLMEMCYLPNVHEYDTSSIKALLSGGSRTSLEHKKLILSKILNNRNVLVSGYASTEIGFVALSKLGEPVDSPQYDSVGRLAAGIEMKIVDITTGKELGPGQDGEILVKSKTFMAGYMNKDLKNVDLDSEGWWHMGDIGHYDENEYLYFTSRLKEIMKYRGVQISPAELETVLHKHPDVVEACVVGKPHDIDGEWPTAFVIKRPNSSLSEYELHAIVDESVADSKKLRGGIFFVDSFPRNSVGKMLKGELVKKLTCS